LETTEKIKKLVQEAIRRRMNSGYACYHSFQDLLSSHQLYKNLKNLKIVYENYKCTYDSSWM
jgi:hypothetical protein